jgi:hypothetical protein
MPPAPAAPPASPAAPAPPPVPSSPPPKDPVKDSRLWGMFCHLAALFGLLGVPLGNILGPFVIWQIKKNEYPFADQQGKESVNFQISVTIYQAVCIPLIFFFCIGLLLIAAINLLSLAFVIIAAVRANSGESYRYPLAIRFIK